MKTNPLNQKGFTMVEVILVVAVIAVLAVVVSPKVVDLRESAFAATRDYVAGAVQDGVNLKYSKTLSNTGSVGTYPTELDTASTGACIDQSSNTAECFGGILVNGITNSDWTKISSNIYRYENLNSYYLYNPSSGYFSCFSSCTP